LNINDELPDEATIVLMKQLLAELASELKRNMMDDAK
jgi:hypothetical protein